MKNKLLICATFFLFSHYVNAQTSWTGTVSSSWTDASNWTAGVPEPTVDAIIGDSNFTGLFQPVIRDQAATCKSLTIGADSIVSILIISKSINISNNIVVGSNGTILHNTGSCIVTVKAVDEIDEITPPLHSQEQ